MDRHQSTFAHNQLNKRPSDRMAYRQDKSNNSYRQHTHNINKPNQKAPLGCHHPISLALFFISWSCPLHFPLFYRPEIALYFHLFILPSSSSSPLFSLEFQCVCLFVYRLVLSSMRRPARYKNQCEVAAIYCRCWPEYEPSTEMKGDRTRKWGRK